MIRIIYSNTEAIQVIGYTLDLEFNSRNIQEKPACSHFSLFSRPIQRNLQYHTFVVNVFEEIPFAVSACTPKCAKMATN